jgi:hypothetical protein
MAVPPMIVVASAIVGPMGRYLVFCRCTSSEDSPQENALSDGIFRSSAQKGAIERRCSSNYIK